MEKLVPIRGNRSVTAGAQLLTVTKFIANRQGEVLFATRQAQILLDTFFSAAPKHRLPVEVLGFGFWVLSLA